MVFVYIISIILCVIALFYLRNGAIPVPTHKKAINDMLELVQVRPGMKIADLGSGDGRILIAFAQAGASTDGFEVNPVLVWWSRIRIKRRKLANAKVYGQSFWPADLSGYDAVVVFGMTHIMERLGKKLESELKPGTVVVSNVFKFPNWQPEAQKGSVRLYRR